MRPVDLREEALPVAAHEPEDSPESICFLGGEIKGAFNVSSEGRGGEQWRSARWRLCSVRRMDSLGGSEPATRRGGW